MCGVTGTPRSRSGLVLLEGIFLVALFVTAPQASAQDPAPELRRAARAAAYRYETLLRRRAPARPYSGSGTDCDEIIGRFCFHFGDSDLPEPAPHPEHRDVVEARRRAISVHRQWLSIAPDDAEAAGALVRYLIEDGEPSQGVPLARTHAWAARRSTGSLMLLGLALHQAGEFETAESVFDSARWSIPDSERARLDDVGVLLEPGERRAYARLSPEEREVYERRFWALADPSLLVAGNERRSAHYARHAWAAILEAAPHASGKLWWGSDHEEILIRYGLPVSRERIRQSGWQRGGDLSVVETFDPNAVSFVFPALRTEGLPWPPLPGETALMERSMARASYAPVRHSRTRAMTIQSGWIPDASGSGHTSLEGAHHHAWTLRVEASIPADTVEPRTPVSPEALLVVLDTMGSELTRERVLAARAADSSTVMGGSVALPPGAYVLRMELIDDSTGLAGLAQYRVETRSVAGVTLSDPLIAAMAEDDLPSHRESLALVPGLVLSPSPVLFWVEAVGLQRVRGTAHYTVEWWLEPLDRGSAVGRAFRWMGRTLGLLSEERAVRVRWEAASAESPVVVSFSVDLAELQPGLHRLAIIVRDRVTGMEAEAERLFRMDPGAADVRTRTRP